MGAAISAMRDAITGGDAAAQEKAMQDLDILQKMVDGQLDKFEAQLNVNFLSPDATSKTEVPGIRALRKVRFSTAEVKEEPAAAISSAIDSFFSIGEANVSTSTALKTGFKSVVEGALNAFLGNTKAGQEEKTEYFVYMHHNSIVRLDVKLWRWNFSGKGFSDTYKRVLGYIICLSVVDVTALKTSEFVYLISEYAGDKEEDIEKYCTAMGNMYSSARKLKASQLARTEEI